MIRRVVPVPPIPFGIKGFRTIRLEGFIRYDIPSGPFRAGFSRSFEAVDRLVRYRSAIGAGPPCETLWPPVPRRPGVQWRWRGCRRVN